jgi:uroporphyrinogen-III synthase
VARARALGFQTEAHPLFELRPLAWSLPAGPFDGLLLTSANAVRLAGTLPDLPVHAVGQATAAAAQAAGATILSVGTGGVDDLLAALDPALRLLHLAGEERVLPNGPRPAVHAVTVYRAEPLPLPAPSSLGGKLLLVHSPAAGRRLSGLEGPREDIRIAAISPAAAAACGSGWERVDASDAPNDSALLSLAVQLCKD